MSEFFREDNSHSWKLIVARRLSSLDFPKQPGTGEGPIIFHRGHGDAEHFRNFIIRSSAEVTEFHDFGLHRVFPAQLVERVVHGPERLDCRRILVLISGADKWRTYVAASGPGPVHDMPVRAVLRQTRTPVNILWAP